METEAPAAAMDTGQGRENHMLVEETPPCPLSSCLEDQVDSTSRTVQPSRPSHESSMSPEQVQCSSKVTQCGSCRTEFDSSKAYLEHVCISEGRRRGDGQDGSDNSSVSDVENFTGKIVYNPDGSAYIIEGADSELSDDECSLDLPQQEGCIVDARGVTPSQFRVFPQVVNALHISRNPALYSALYGQAYSLLQEKKKVPEVPVMHSYRVFTMSDKRATKSGNFNDDTNLGSSSVDKCNFPILDYTSVPIKPILMCFICKLSFGYTKSFVAHAVGEHNITMADEEKEIMSRKNASAVIQGVGKEKEPLLSFLEPIPTSSAQVSGYPKLPSAYYVPNSSCPSSFASKDPVFLNAVSTAVSSAMRYNSAVTTLVSATSSPVSSSIPEISRPKSSSLTRQSLGGPDTEVLAPELEDLANIEKMAKAAAAAAAEASATRSMSSPTTIKQQEKGGSPNGHVEEADSSGANLFAFGSGLERPTSTESTSPGAHMSPKRMTAPSPVVPTCHSPAPSTSSPVCVCVQHPDGKPNGVECPKCDIVMGVTRSLGNQMTMMHSRNSCKTLKCPKCNWHYKYQETLEIHMKEKHPENEMSCIYCLTNQPHPRLARGETYTCGYKPYRCEVCNYSTTTKGNLSIHMQSDKHINNVQELQNGNISADHMLQPQGLPAPPLPDPMKKAPPTNKPKATWRCDVCNYETNVARNLRIHMTSEKHTHNMMVLQQNVKHMQQFTAFQQAQALDPLFQFHPGLLLPCDTQLQPEAALADMAYNHALLMMASQQQQQQQQQQQRAMAAAAAVAAVSGTGKGTLGPPMNMVGGIDVTEHGDTSLRTDVPYDDSHKLFQCCVCNVYSADNIETLNQHMQQDRTWQREEEILMAVAGSYICKLCTYKTNLKANFQLHCKTDKHLQRLQHFNHVKEGGPATEWKLKYMNVSNPVQVRCNACDYYTNSIHKLQLHTANPRHETSSKLFLHLQLKEGALNVDNKYYSCKLCHFFTRTKLNLIQHVHSLRHLRNENIRQMQLKTEGREIVEDIFLVREYRGNEKIIFDADVDTLPTEVEEKLEEKPESSTKSGETSTLAPMLKQALMETPKEISSLSVGNENDAHTCPFCNYTSNSEASIQLHLVSQHSKKPVMISCPLCQEHFDEWKKLEVHLMEVHHVNQEGVQRLLLMVDQSDWVSSSNKQASSTSTGEDTTDVRPKQQESNEGKNESDEAEKASSGEDAVFDELPCSGCAKMFSNVDDLFSHQNELGHLELKQTPRGPGYLCWKKGCSQYFTTALALQMHFREVHAQTPPLAVSERHVYKYRCNQCSLAFKTLEKLQLHSQYHAIRAATQCVLCGRSFRSVAALQKHVETFHTDMSKEELDQYRASLANNPLLVSGNGGGVLDPQTTELLKKESNRDEEQLEDQTDMSGQDEFATEAETDTTEGGEQGNNDCPKDQEGLEDYINSQAVAEDSYNDPTRKYKCHRCKVAFTRQSYLTSHNKTLLHRKGEKLSYPMEKYLDPNRPHKCDICMESFTQKNILLVHYNSVSHLHKLKQSMKENSTACSSSAVSSPNNSTVNTNSNTLTTTTTTTTVAASTTTTTTTTITATTTTATATVTTNSASSGSPIDSYNKPYKCNICKVAYSQGSTLDIHIRSVLHQTRASKLHELAMTGQVDLNVPLIEKPEPGQVQEPAENTSCSSNTMPQLTQVISPSTSVPSTAQIPKLPDVSEVPLSSTATTGSTPVTSASPQLSVPADLSSLLPPHSAHLPVPLPSQSVLSCQRCSAIFISQEALLQHQQLCCFFSQPSQSLLSRVSAITTNSQMPLIPGLTPPQLQVNDLFQQKDDQDQASNVTYPPELLALKHHPPQLSPQLTQHLLRAKYQTFPRSKPLIYKHLLESFGFDVVMQFNEYRQKYMHKDKSKDQSVKEIDITEKKENKKSIEYTENEKLKDTDLPEINRSVCTKCLKEFSSVWVLKAHREEIHGQIVPVDLVEKFADEFRIDYEKKLAQSPSTGGQDDTGSHTDVSSPAISGEPNICPTPSLPLSMSVTSPSVTSLASQSEMNSTTNQMAAQLQFNQLLMSMGLGMGLPMGMNMPFSAAMNLHPPLIPVMMPPPLDPLMASAFNHPMMPGTMDPNFFATQQKLLQQQQQQLIQAQQQQKRARTRISDEQLKILRAYFDINNSPSEEQLVEMSDKSGLPLKVIKHWFRNTLFKERQRNKDSPYNFSNPPSTYLNLEEYEKTGETKVIPVSKDDTQQNGNQSEQSRFSSADETDSSQDAKSKQETPNHSMISEDDVSEQKGDGLSLSHPSDPIIPDPTVASSSLADSVRLSDHASCSSHPLTSFPLSSTCASPSLESTKLSNAISASSMCIMTNSTSSGKRANRTRFTDYQIKMLQEFFETNAYPKDDDLEYLSKMLNLSPRVIVVWFQNARQKARKVYENQPPVIPEDDTGRFQRTPGLNYQCKKCLQVFQRYYELIKHQKSSCFKDENPLSSQAKPVPNVDEKTSSPSPSAIRSPEKISQNGTYRCDKCSLAFPRSDLWREHQIVHIMNPSLFPNYSSNSSFGILQYEAQQQSNPAKRKLPEEEDAKETEQPKDKRLRTTILPEQLDYLYQKYQMESNPSRKMLENIAREVGLKKRVVQVWFQNTRARERKGQFRAHQQVIHKRCPFCRALFKARSALESHLATRHADQYTRGDINIDALPDGDGDSNQEMPSTTESGGEEKSATAAIPTSSSSSPSVPSTSAECMQNSMKKYYEDSLKKYLNDLCCATKESTAIPSELATTKQAKSADKKEGGDCPLDLSKSMKMVLDAERSQDDIFTTLSDDGFSRSIYYDDTRSETHSESTDMDMEDVSYESNPTSPSPMTHSSHRTSGSGKRFRTQMTTTQLKVMKSIFVDYKTPSMAECEMLGREISLPKRVVQVWFQNARAKEKKAKLAFAKTFGQEMETNKPPEKCNFCNVKYDTKYSNTSMQDHLFSKRHIDLLKTHIDNIKKLTEGQDSTVERPDIPSTPGSNALEQLVQHQELERASGQPNLMQQLQMMGLQQMAGLPIPMNLPPFGQGTGLLGMSLATGNKDEKAVSASVKKDNNNSSNENGSKSPSEHSTPAQTVQKQQQPSQQQQQESQKKDTAQTPTSQANPMVNHGMDFPLPTSEATNLFPYMYTGFPSYYSGVPGSLFHPAVYQGRSDV